MLEWNEVKRRIEDILNDRCMNGWTAEVVHDEKFHESDVADLILTFQRPYHDKPLSRHISTVQRTNDDIEFESGTDCWENLSEIWQWLYWDLLQQVEYSERLCLKITKAADK